jgi:hypothetical protein
MKGASTQLTWEHLLLENNPEPDLARLPIIRRNVKDKKDETVLALV